MFSSSAYDPALGRPFSFEESGTATDRLGRDIARYVSTIPKLAGVVPASRLEVKPAPEMASSGICEMDALTGGLPRGKLTEICGAASSGRTSVLLAALAAATQRQEACALVDVSDAFDPASAAAAGMDFSRLLWVRCGEVSPRRRGDMERRKKKFQGSGDAQQVHDFGDGMSSMNRVSVLESERVEQALRATDLLLQSGGFGLVVIDLGDASVKLARRIPLASWFRFQRVVEGTPTILFTVTPLPCAQSCAALLLGVQSRAVARQSSEEPSAIGSQYSEKPSHARLLKGLHVEVEILRSRFTSMQSDHSYVARFERKPVQPVTFATKTVSAG